MRGDVQPGLRGIRLAAIAIATILLGAAPARADFHIDWDSGGGTGFGIHFVPSSGSSPRESAAPGRPWPDDSYLQYEQARRIEQEKAAAELAKKKKEEAERRERERALEEQIAQTQQVQRVMRLRRQLAEMRAKRDAVVDHDLPIRSELVEDLPQFDALWIQQSREHNELLERIAHSLDRIKVPAPAQRHIKRALFLGWTGTPDEALAMQTRHAKSPFDGERYDSISGFALPNPVVDAPRVALDHLLLGYGLPTPERNLERVAAQLKGATIDELVAHSNGAAVAEAMIAHGDLKVRTLRIVGGDGALMNLESLDRLAATHQMQIYVYANAGDVVPMISLGWKLRAKVDRLLDPASFDLTQESVDAHGFVYTVLGFGHPRAPPWSDRLHVVLLSTPFSPVHVVRNHVYETYYGLLNAMRLLAHRP